MKKQAKAKKFTKKAVKTKMNFKTGALDSDGDIDPPKKPKDLQKRKKK